MGKKKNKFNYRDWECIDPDEHNSRITDNCRRSIAFKTLNKSQTDLLLLCVHQVYEKIKPMKVHPGYYCEDDIYLNWALVSRSEDALYKDNRNGQTKFRQDIKVLIEHGFIKCITNGKSNHSRSVYQMSGDWKVWRPIKVDP